MARALLQPPAAEVLARRVATLSASRAAAVDAADAERRRIERDLHDGTQQRLVSLAMTLGMTRTAVRDAGPEVRQAVADAHEEAKLALAELRLVEQVVHAGETFWEPGGDVIHYQDGNNLSDTETTFIVVMFCVPGQPMFVPVSSEELEQRRNRRAPRR